MQEKKFKIGLFIDSFFPTIDGVAVGINSIGKILSKSVDLTVFCPAPKDGVYDDSDRPYKVIRCRSKKIPFVKKIDYDWPKPNSDKEFKKKLKESNLDLVHIRSPFAVGKMGLRYAKKHRIPTVITLHSQFKKDFYKATKSKMLTAIMMRNIMKVFNATDEAWTVNEASKAVLREYGINKEPIAMENGTDMLPIENKGLARSEINAEYGLTDTEKVLLYVGRIVKVKNIFFIADVLRQLKESGQHFKMIFVGVGAETEDLTTKLNDYGLADNVIFAGLIKDREKLAKFYVRADLFMFPSFYDTDGVVKKEAACQHTPIICIADSIVADSVKDGHNAYVGPNTVEGFADVVTRALTDEVEYKKICDNAHKELYITWAKTAENTLERYRALIEGENEKH